MVQELQLNSLIVLQGTVNHSTTGTWILPVIMPNEWGSPSIQSSMH
jgi:hypothetical protein